jgi:hypothetical protein
VLAFYESLGYEDGEVVVLGRFLDEQVPMLRPEAVLRGDSGLPASRCLEEPQRRP